MSSRSNWTKYRDHLHNKTTPPCVPFLGMYLTDLVRESVGNKINERCLLKREIQIE